MKGVIISYIILWSHSEWISTFTLNCKMKIFFHLCVQCRKIWLQVCSQIWKKLPWPRFLLWCEVKPACSPSKLKKMIFNHLNNVYADFQNQLQYTFVFTEIYVWNSMSTTWQISKRLYIKCLLIFLPNFYAEHYW